MIKRVIGVVVAPVLVIESLLLFATAVGIFFGVLKNL